MLPLLKGNLDLEQNQKTYSTINSVYLKSAFYRFENSKSRVQHIAHSNPKMPNSGVSQGTLFADINSTANKHTNNIFNTLNSRFSSRTWGKKTGSTGEFSHKNIKNKPIGSFSPNTSPLKNAIGLGLADKNQNRLIWSPEVEREQENCSQSKF
jgi:hypothetical protein